MELSKQTVTKYVVDYNSHFTVNKNDSIIELTEWNNGEGIDIIITGPDQTQYISLGDQDILALEKLLNSFLYD